MHLIMEVTLAPWFFHSEASLDNEMDDKWLNHFNQRSRLKFKIHRDEKEKNLLNMVRLQFTDPALKSDRINKDILLYLLLTRHIKHSRNKEG